MSDWEDGSHPPARAGGWDLDAAAVGYARGAAGAPAPRRRRLRDEFVRSALPFAARLAGRYHGRGEPLEDLEQVARLGLVLAVDRYDPARGSFTAYAACTIRGEIKRHFRDRTWGVHVPRRLQGLGREVRQAQALLTGQLSRGPTVAELAAHLRTTDGEITAALASAAGYSPASLDGAGGPGDGTRSDPGDLLATRDAALESADDRLTMAHLLCRLPPRERRILALRFYGNRTQADIAADVGVSQMHVSRLLRQALAWLRRAMLSDSPSPWPGPRDDLTELRIRVARTGDAVTVAVHGEVDRDTVAPLRRQLVAAVRAPGTRVVWLDLSGVPLLDAAGAAALLAAHELGRAVGVRLRLRRVQPHAARTLAVTGLAHLLVPAPAATQLSAARLSRSAAPGPAWSARPAPRRRPRRAAPPPAADDGGAAPRPPAGVPPSRPPRR